jgi:hypothetical protein
MRVVDSCQSLLLPSEVLDLMDIEMGKQVIEASSENISEFVRRKGLLQYRLAEYISQQSSSETLVESLLSLGLPDAAVVRLVQLRKAAVSVLGPVFVDHVLRLSLPPEGLEVEEVIKVLKQEEESIDSSLKRRHIEE